MITVFPLILLLLGAPVKLTWNPNSPEENVDHYRVYRAENGRPYALMEEIPAKNYPRTVDKRTLSGQTYCYEVTAVSGNQESLPSEPACVTIP
jgi:fibronectin type 3 domain-containing protein